MKCKFNIFIFINNRIVYRKTKEKSSLDKNKVPFIEINSKEDEKRAVKAAKYADYVIVSGNEWKIIPYENLIAEIKDSKIVATAIDTNEAKVNLGTLEKGCDAILLNSKPTEIKKTAKLLQEMNQENFKLVKAEVTDVKEVGMGDRVCIDTCSMLKVGERKF